MVAEWSEQNKLLLNGEKSEVAVFSLSHADTAWAPNVSIRGRTVRLNPHPRLLGVILDRTLTFGAHVAHILAKVAKKSNILRAVAHSSWGWRKSDLRRVFSSHIRSVMNYAGAAWQPWLSDTNVSALETAQNRCLRIITTQSATTPTEALRAESGIGSMASCVRANTLRSREKALRLPSDHPRFQTFHKSTTNRLRRPCARSRAAALSQELLPDVDEAPRAPFVPSFSVRPWNRGLPYGIVHTSLPGVSGREDNRDTILEMAVARVLELNCDVNIYTDGSAEGGTTEGGAAIVVTTGDPAHPIVTETIHIRGATITCSFEEECRAMWRAIDWLVTNAPGIQSAAVFTDSQSLCVALEGTHQGIAPLREAISSLSRSIALSIQWIPGHCNIPGNDLADAAAKAAAKAAITPMSDAASRIPNEVTCGTSAGITFSAICARIRAATRDPPPSHPRTKEVYSKMTPSREALVRTRADQSLLAKIRSGHFIGFNAYKARIDGRTDPTCPRCREGQHDLEHWLTTCPATAALRARLFGPDEDHTLALLTSHPVQCLALARSTLLLGA